MRSFLHKTLLVSLLAVAVSASAAGRVPDTPSVTTIVTSGMQSKGAAIGTTVVNQVIMSSSLPALEVAPMPGAVAIVEQLYGFDGSVDFNRGIGDIASANRARFFAYFDSTSLISKGVAANGTAKLDVVVRELDPYEGVLANLVYLPLKKHYEIDDSPSGGVTVSIDKITSSPTTYATTA